MAAESVGGWRCWGFVLGVGVGVGVVFGVFGGFGFCGECMWLWGGGLGEG